MFVVFMLFIFIFTQLSRIALLNFNFSFRLENILLIKMMLSLQKWTQQLMN